MIDLNTIENIIPHPVELTTMKIVNYFITNNIRYSKARTRRNSELIQKN